MYEGPPPIKKTPLWQRIALLLMILLSNGALLWLLYEPAATSTVNAAVFLCFSPTPWVVMGYVLLKDGRSGVEAGCRLAILLTLLSCVLFTWLALLLGVRLSTG
jgi:hypothetical protein